MSPSSPCVVLVPFAHAIVPECEQSLRALERRGYPVWRVPGFSTIDLGRCVLARDALAAGFEELMWIDADIAFHPDDVDKLRQYQLPLVGGLAAKKGRRELACAFLPGTDKVLLGPSGGLMELRYADLSFFLTRRHVYGEIKRRLELPECNQRFGDPLIPWFLPLLTPDGDGLWYLAEDYAFCERARRCGFRILADTTVRLWHFGSYGFSWEDAGSDKERYADYTFFIPPPANATPVVPASSLAPAEIPPRVQPPRGSLREEARPLPPGFPRLGASILSYPANRESLQQTLDSFRASDWGEEPAVFVQPADWPTGRPAASRNYKRALQAAAAAGWDFAVILEDDVRVNRWLRHNLQTIPLLQRDQCDYFCLFMPDLIASPWERHEAHLGYRLAKPLYSGPNQLWEKHRLWGSQAYVLSRRFLLRAVERWDDLQEGQDSRVLTLCGEHRLPLWYSAPSLVQHAPLRTAFATPPAYAADFQADFRWQAAGGFQPPEEVPGWLTWEEGRLLWELAAGRNVLELGTANGRATVCLAQQASRVVTLDVRDQTEAQEWVRRYGLSARVEFRRGKIAETCRALKERFDLVFIDTEHDAASVGRDIEAVLPLLVSGGLAAFHDYPDPGWPDVRRVVDEYAARHSWRRVAQADYLGVFRVGSGDDSKDQ